MDPLEEMIRKEDKQMIIRERKIAKEHKLRMERAKSEGLHRGKRTKKDTVLDMLNPSSSGSHPKRKRYARFVEYTSQRKGEKSK